IIVGLSAVVSSSYEQVIRLSSIVREICPNAWIVVGGNLSASAEVLLSKTETDICVVGDGEIAWVNFLNYEVI
ncbi:MAG: radical SAM protein, partial [Pseudomonadota bacterium]